MVKKFRQDLKASDGIFMKTEFHATTFVSGRGRIAAQVITKYRRTRIFEETLRLVASLPGVFLINACDRRNAEERLYERFLMRIHNTMGAKHSRAVLISDEGKDYTSLLRRMGVHNPIPSMYGDWGGASTKNITVNNLIEDLLFRKSHRSYFIQLADFCAYALLRSESPVASRNKYGLDKSFNLLVPVCTPQCFKDDPRKLGIIRAG
jgi:hypothetical protein